MGFFGLFGGKSKTASIIKEVKETGDSWFTSDEERQDFHHKMEQLASNSDNVIARTGRASLMWMFSLVAFYNWVIRDLLSIILERELPPPAIDAAGLAKSLLGLLAGTL